MILAPSIEAMIRSSTLDSVFLEPCVSDPVTMMRSPAFQPFTGSASDTAVSPLLAVAPSFTQLRLSGWPCESQRPPQHTMAGHESLFIPSTKCRRIFAVFAIGFSGVPKINAACDFVADSVCSCMSQSNPSSEYSSPG